MRQRLLLPSKPGPGFTLLELLIVVAIIAILAAIALPNFLEAQTRSKVSRVRADLRTVATALEAYCMDSSVYPPNEPVYAILPVELTTPISYISSGRISDPFTDKDVDPLHGLLVRYYTYHKIVTPEQAVQDIDAGRAPPNEAVDFDHYNPGAVEKYGTWKLLSFGPDRRYSDQSFQMIDPVLLGSDILYDPTNGSVSWGNILRTQKFPDGRIAP